jgi:hypothetical protein
LQHRCHDSGTFDNIYRSLLQNSDAFMPDEDNGRHVMNIPGLGRMYSVAEKDACDALIMLGHTGWTKGPPIPCAAAKNDDVLVDSMSPRRSNEEAAGDATTRQSRLRTPAVCRFINDEDMEDEVESSANARV